MLKPCVCWNWESSPATPTNPAVAATLAATAEAEFLRHKKIGAHGVDIAISPSDIYDMTSYRSGQTGCCPTECACCPR